MHYYLIISRQESKTRQSTARTFHGVRCIAAAVAAAQGGSENVALNKVTWQSSMGRGGVSERAVDGNKASNWESNSCTHTHPDATELPVWGVDLGVELEVAYVEVTNRVSCEYIDNT